MRPHLRPTATLALLLALPRPGAAQETAPTTALRVFLDCPPFYCDFDHIRREIGFVDWVRDRKDAQLHVLVTTQRTGGGGTEFTLTFIGLRELEGRGDTLRYVSRQTDTRAERREGLTRTLTLGLVRYVAGTPAGRRLRVTYAAQEEGAPAPASPEEDRWNFWVFRTRIGGFFNGEEQTSSLSLNGSLSASRTTEELKVTLSLFGRYSRNSFDLDETTTFVTSQRNLGFNAVAVKSVGPHWSVGLRGSVSSSTFLNQDLAVRAGPGVEYDIFPYGESTRRRLTVLYSVGVAGFDYEEETIFDRTSEVLPAHNLEVGLELTQPWGSINTSVEAFQFLHDPTKHRVDLFGGLNIRLFKGLSLNLFGSVSRVKDQLYLAKAGLTPEEILVRRRQLGTDFRYFANVGLSYTFGSIFNNIVNPRFGGAGGPIIIVN